MTKASSKGFTLLEVLLALAIFSIIALATAQQIRVVANTKEAALTQMDQYNAVRSALAVLRNDLSQAFHVSYDDLGDEIKAKILQSQPVAHTIFDGRKSEMVFTSLSHRVYYAGKRESEQTELSFFLRSAGGRSKYGSLMKRESEMIDSDLFQGGTIYTLLENVSDLRFQYWDDKTNRWGDDWNSDGGETRDKFPKAVKVSVTTFDPKTKRELKVSTSFKIAFPNNDPQLVKFQ